MRARIAALVLTIAVTAGCAQAPSATPRRSPSPVSEVTPAPPCASGKNCLPARTGAGFAFDQVRLAMVAFGGVADVAGQRKVLDETWEWKPGFGWKRQHPATTPPARSLATLVYDPDLKAVLMYGGRDVDSNLHQGGTGNRVNYAADTWTWNGLDWSQLEPVHAPDLYLPAGGFDSVNHQVVLETPVQTWTFNGVDWALKSEYRSGLYPPGEQPLLAYDPANRWLTLFGGSDPQGADTSHMWRWDGARWTPVSTVAPAVGRAAATGLNSSGKMLLVGLTAELSATTWTWGGSQWTQANPATPIEVVPIQLFYSSASSGAVLVAYSRADGTSIQVWAWNGADWRLLD